VPVSPAVVNRKMKAGDHSIDGLNFIFNPQIVVTKLSKVRTYVTRFLQLTHTFKIS